MITRFAMFEGSVKPGQTEAFRKAVLERLVPLWTSFPGNTDVAVMFSEECDEGAPEFPLILAISYPDQAAMEGALEAPARYQSKEVTGEIVESSLRGGFIIMSRSATGFPPDARPRAGHHARCCAQIGRVPYDGLACLAGR